jgi:outer membrane protein assembly factor BamB
MVKNGGIVSCLDARTGQPTKDSTAGDNFRVSGKGDYYSSPVAGDGKIYLLSERGELSVITAEPKWKEIHSSRFGEKAHATPAIVGGRIFLRTAGHLYCFGLQDGDRDDH